MIMFVNEDVQRTLDDIKLSRRTRNNQSVDGGNSRCVWPEAQHALHV